MAASSLAVCLLELREREPNSVTAERQLCRDPGGDLDLDTGAQRILASERRLERLADDRERASEQPPDSRIVAALEQHQTSHAAGEKALVEVLVADAFDRVHILGLNRLVERLLAFRREQAGLRGPRGRRGSGWAASALALSSADGLLVVDAWDACVCGHGLAAARVSGVAGAAGTNRRANSPLRDVQPNAGSDLDRLAHPKAHRVLPPVTDEPTLTLSLRQCQKRENQADVMPLLYPLFVGIPLCLVAVTFGLLACLTIVGIPIGITLIALGVKALSYPAPTRYTVRITERR